MRRIPFNKHGPMLGCYNCNKRAHFEVITELDDYFQLRRLCVRCLTKAGYKIG
jgi:hypothetical protein